MAKAAADELERAKANRAVSGAATVQSRPRKLSNKERAELEALPKRIEALEAEQAELTAKLGDAEFFKKGGAEVTKATARLSEIEGELAAAYARWEALEA
jgi:ATP-binding cassette subfamily F protein uup